MVSSPLPAAIGTAPSVRPGHENAGGKHGGANCSPARTSMSSSPCRPNWRPWLSTTKNSSTIYCSRPVPKPSSRSPAHPAISEPRSASSACSIPGISSCNFIPMSTASSPPVDCRSITPTGSQPALASFSPSRCCAGYFAVSSGPLSSQLFSTASSASPRTSDCSRNPRSSLPGCDPCFANTG